MPARRLLTALAAAVLVAASAPAATAATDARSRPAAVPGLPGFDISGATTSVDWGRAASLGAAFVFITATEGTSHQYGNFPALAAGARAAGLAVGASHFATPSASGGAAQADYFAAHGGGWSADHQTLPGTLDLEFSPTGAACYGLSQTAMTNWISGFLNEYRTRTGRWAIIYTTTAWWTQCTGDSPAFNAPDPLFIARLATPPSPGPLPGGWTKYTFWQYAATGDLPGGQDVFNGSRTELTALADNT